MDETTCTPTLTIGLPVWNSDLMIDVPGVIATVVIPAISLN